MSNSLQKRPPITFDGLSAHLKTVNKHRALVRELCFKAGLPLQGLTHDLSKYAPVEFLVGARYFQGTRSPNTAEREALGFSKAWLHHKGRNKHHFEYWIDATKDSKGQFLGIPMPKRYVVEMLCDRIAACKVYQGEAYTQQSALRYYLQNMAYNSGMHETTARELERMLRMVAVLGEDEALSRIKEELRHTGR